VAYVILRWNTGCGFGKAKCLSVIGPRRHAYCGETWMHHETPGHTSHQFSHGHRWATPEID
jgi:hypothetical protein